MHGRACGHGTVLAKSRGDVDSLVRIDGIERRESSALLRWLNRGLRRGLEGRLEGEYPLSLNPGRVEGHRVARRKEERFGGDEIVAHAMFHRTRIQVHEARLELGLIGLVYTEPHMRGRGLGSRCVEACVETLRESGVPLVALWSDREGFYARLGFHPAGRETLLVFDTACIRRAQRRLPHPAEASLRVAPWEPRDLPDLERLYARHPVRAQREPGALLALAKGPEVQLHVARRDGVAVAYAARGRGDDFRGVVHEWAGEAPAVLACLESLLPRGGALALLGGPGDEQPVPALRQAGASVRRGALGLLRLLDARALWRAITQGDAALASVGLRSEGDRVVCEGSAGSCCLDAPRVLSLLLDGCDLDGLAPALSYEEQEALAKHLPWPLYLWGFDSI